MLPVFVRPAKASDRKLFCEWALSTRNNEIDPSVLTYKNTSIRAICNKNGPIMFAPIQRPLHLESLCINPSASIGEIAVALQTLFQDAITSAIQEGSGEIYYVATEETIPTFSKKFGFEELPWKVYRLRISDIEKRSDHGKEKSASNKNP
jgi:hypothetical protein